MLNFDKIYEYFNTELNALKDEQLGDSLYDVSIPMECVSLKYDGGDLAEGTDYTVSGRVITVTNTAVTAANCFVFKDGVQMSEFTVSGSNITIGTETLTAFDLEMHKNVGDYLERIKHGEDYTSNGVIEHLGIEYDDTRLSTYYHTVGVSLTTLAEYRDIALLLCTAFAQEQHDKITSITVGSETYDLHIKVNRFPDQSQNEKAHGQEEFNTFMVFDVKISVALDSSNNTETYINGTLIPYATVDVSKVTNIEVDGAKSTYAKNRAKQNTIIIEITGTMTSDNAELQALKQDIENPDSFELTYLIKRQKGALLVNEVDYDIEARTLELADVTLDISKLKIYNGTTLLTVTNDYTVSNGVITITDSNITMTELVLIWGENCYIREYSMLLTEGDIINAYGSDITYRALFQMKL